MRGLYDITKDQAERLKLYSKKKMISRAEIIRKALDSYLPPSKSESIRMHQAVGLWTDSKDSLAYVRKLREEWS